MGSVGVQGRLIQPGEPVLLESRASVVPGGWLVDEIKFAGAQDFLIM